MTATELIRRLHQHRIWVDRKLITACTDLTDEQLRQRFSIGQGSVWSTLTHLMAAEYVWLQAIQGNESPTMPGDLPSQLPGNQLGENAISSLAELSSFWDELHQEWEQFLWELDPSQLRRPVYKVSTSSRAGERLAAAMSDILLHVCTHAQYTSAQMVNMLKQLGVSPLPDVMLISLARRSDSGRKSM